MQQRCYNNLSSLVANDSGHLRICTTNVCVSVYVYIELLVMCGTLTCVYSGGEVGAVGPEEAEDCTAEATSVATTCFYNRRVDVFDRESGRSWRWRDGAWARL